MLENRSFDHMLGFSQIEGINASNNMPTRIDGLEGIESNASPGVGDVRVSFPADFIINPDPGHEFTDVREQLCGKDGTYSTPTLSPGSIDSSIDNGGFVSNYVGKYPGQDPNIVMRCYSPNQLPVLTTLAREFAVCDHWFSSMPGPTWPNRFFVHAATAGGLDHSPPLPKEIASFTGLTYRFSNGTIFDLLDNEGLDWAIYCGDAFPQSLHMQGMVDNCIKGRFIQFNNFKRDLQSGDFPKSYVFIEPDWHPFTQFRCGNSQHPVDDVTRGEWLLKEVYEAIRNSPLWEKSLLIITYDEHGGFYDHVSPPTTVNPGDGATNPDNDRYGFNFQQLGVRVPAVVVSSHIPRGTIDHRTYEHSSVLTTVENIFRLSNLTERDKHTAPLDGMLSLSQPRTDAPMTLPTPAASGFRCTPESELVAELRYFFGRIPTFLHLNSPKPPDPSLAGFVHVALLRKMSSSSSEDKARLLSQAGRINNQADALRFLRHNNAPFGSILR